jgi:hypothetical protein
MASHREFAHDKAMKELKEIKNTKTGKTIHELMRLVTPLALAALCLAPSALASDYDGSVWLTSAAPAPNGGTWVQIHTGIETGRTEARGGAPQYDSVDEPGTIVAVPGKVGYWVVTKRGAIHRRGQAPDLCGGHLQNCSTFPPNPADWEFITSAAATPDGQGLWAVGRRGQVWTAGTAKPLGDAIEGYDLTATAIVPTPSGNGYYILKNDGGVHARGDAVFHGSTGGGTFHRNYTGLVLSRTASGTVNGYWMLNKDGGITTYGDATFLGSTGGNTENITSLFSVDQGTRYAWIHRNGEITVSGSYRRGAVTSNTSGTTRLWTLQGNLDYPGAELHTLLPGAGRADNWIFWPVKRSGATLYQLRNERNGLCVELRGYDVSQGACLSNLEGTQQTQGFSIETSGSYLYLVVPDWPRLVLSTMPGQTRLQLVDRTTLSPSQVSRWQVLEPATIYSADSNTLFQAAENNQAAVAADAANPAQKWLIAPTSDLPDAPVRFIEATTGRCAEAQSAERGYRLHLSACLQTSPAQEFQLHESGEGLFRIAPAFSGLTAAPSAGTPGEVEFVPTTQGIRWRLQAATAH